MTLTATQFPDFYEAVNGYAPFPWQARLVREIDAAGGRWPAVLDLPTSSGKTSALDAAVFLLAMQAGRSVHDRTAAIRTFFVVDRRIVVDEAADKARKLARLLNADEIADPVVREVAEALKSFSGGPKALHVSVLRGGMYRDGSWAESPTQPTICLSTVDQVGSRLLFRGYGVSPYQRAVHAGLVGNDALILLDEAHLSRPFLETLKAVEFYRSERWAECPVKTPFGVVVMSATAGNAVEPVVKPPDWKIDPFQLGQEDRDDPILKQRLGASKRAELADVKGGAEEEERNRQEFAEAIAGFARNLADPPLAPARKGKAQATFDFARPVQVVGIVVNRVDTARRVHRALLAGRDAEAPTFDVILLTGRIRPYDRDRLLCKWFRYMEADKRRDAPPCGRLYVVATQTVEVGANLSFDALVTEAAPIDALRQRFGRLDRLGLRGTSRAVIVARKDLLKTADPVYGNKSKETWDWLGEHLTGPSKAKYVDFGIDAMAGHDRAELEDLCAPFAVAPVMMPAHVDDWVQTSVAPAPDPDPALFLHGPNSGPADVSVVWRADITEEMLRDGETAREVVALVPPVSMEALPLPIWQVQKWLRDRTASADFTDVEGEHDPEPNRKPDERASRPFLIWKGPERKKGTRVSFTPGEIRPGNTIIVPSGYGGCDEFGWNPDHRGDVADVGDDCSWRAKRRPVLRVHRDSGVHRRALETWQIPPDDSGKTLADALTAATKPDETTGETPKRAALSVFRSWSSLPDWLGAAVKDRKAREIPYPKRVGVVILMPVQKPDRNEGTFESDAPADDDGGSFLGTDDFDREKRDAFVSLHDHCRAVGGWARGFTHSLRLLDEFAGPVIRAALLHDAGKADRRFQEWLYGSEVEAARNEFHLIAKSKMEARNSAAVEAARRRAGWPKAGRHEAASVPLARSDPATFAGLSDPELCEYLIGTHHGRGRPLWPFTEDDEAAESPGPLPSFVLNGFTLSADRLEARPEDALAPLHAGWVDLFWRMVRKYGHWGLAFLETLLVLADHRQSEAEKEGRR